MINENGLYKCTCPEKYYLEKNNDRLFLYHCKNWTFRPRMVNGRIFMIDTYFDSWDSRIEIKDDKIEDFEFVFDFNKVKRIADWEIDEYEESDLYRVATNSGGNTCGNLHWVNKTAVKSRNKLREKSLKRIKELERSLEFEKKKLKELENMVE